MLIKVTQAYDQIYVSLTFPLSAPSVMVFSISFQFYSSSFALSLKTIFKTMVRELSSVPCSWASSSHLATDACYVRPLLIRRREKKPHRFADVLLYLHPMCGMSVLSMLFCRFPHCLTSVHFPSGLTTLRSLDSWSFQLTSYFEISVIFTVSIRSSSCPSDLHRIHKFFRWSLLCWFWGYLLHLHFTLTR